MEIANVAQCCILFLALLISLTLHEWGYALAADKLGDATPRSYGRVSLNPLVHIDLLGTIIFPLLCIFLSPGIVFGWGKPVPINTMNFKKPQKGEMIVGLIGLLVHVVICLICSAIIAFLPSLQVVACYTLLINSFLIVFNLLPLPSSDLFPAFKYLFKPSQEVIDFLTNWCFFIFLIAINIPIVRIFLSVTCSSIFNFFMNLFSYLHRLF